MEYMTSNTASLLSFQNIMFIIPYSPSLTNQPKRKKERQEMKNPSFENIYPLPLSFYPAITIILSPSASSSPSSSSTGPSATSRTGTTTTTMTHRPRPGKRILGKRARERPLARHLLGADERVDRDGDGAIDVDATAVLGQPHPGKGLAQTDDGFKMPDLS